MRAIVGISLLLLAMGMLLCRAEGLAARGPREPVAGQWVRTVDGWERTDTWSVAAVPPGRLHPLVVAAGQGLASLLALAACQREGGSAGRKCWRG